LKRERLVYCGEETSLQIKGEPLKKTHLRPLHWHKGTEAFHKDSKRFSVLPCSEPLIFPRRSSTSEEAQDKEAGSPRVVPLVKKKRSKKKTM
jgi:hypothetical protein